jgi:hypothetical protein
VQGKDAEGLLTLHRADHAGDLVGCVFARTKGDALYIGKLAVRPAARSRKSVPSSRPVTGPTKLIVPCQRASGAMKTSRCAAPLSDHPLQLRAGEDALTH